MEIFRWLSRGCGEPGTNARMRRLLGARPKASRYVHAQPKDVTGIERVALEYAAEAAIDGLLEIPICDLPAAYLMGEVKLSTDDLYVPGSRLPRHIGRWVAEEERG